MKKIFLVLLLSLTLVLPSFGAEIILLNPVSVKGHYVSPSVVIPDTVVGSGDIIIVASLADLQDPMKTIAFEVELSDDGGVTWVPYFSFVYIGGVYTSPDGSVLNPPPGGGFEFFRVAGKQMRFVMDIPIRMNIGVNMIY